MSRIITVHSSALRHQRAVEMGYIRWHEVSRELGALGHTVDLASAELRRRFPPRVESIAPNVRIVPITRVKWDEYDVVLTMCHSGFEKYERYGGGAHRCLIAELGSVVAPVDREGIFFYGKQREALFRGQERMHRASRYVAVLSGPARALWDECFGGGDEVLLVPGGAPTQVPPPGRSPYAPDGRPACVFAGNFYDRTPASQPEAHERLATKLNTLGRLLDASGARLYLVGIGDHRSLDPRYVTYLGAAPYERSWDYLYHAAVGIVLTAGGPMHNNESSKIYYYLRVGLPVVSEAGFPNDHVVHASGLGFVVENGALDQLAERAVHAAARAWDRDHAMRFILENHTWRSRAEVYDRAIREAV
jgi:hypothetical protein